MPADIHTKCGEPVAFLREGDEIRYVHINTWYCPAGEEA